MPSVHRAGGELASSNNCGRVPSGSGRRQERWTALRRRPPARTRRTSRDSSRPRRARTSRGAEKEISMAEKILGPDGQRRKRLGLTVPLLLLTALVLLATGGPGLVRVHDAVAAASG